MNPTRLLLLIAITALLGSCTKDYPTPENPVIASIEAPFLLEQPPILNEEPLIEFEGYSTPESSFSLEQISTLNEASLNAFEGNSTPESSIEFFYPEDSGTSSDDDRLALFRPLHTPQPCKDDIPSILIPRIIDNKIEIIYANIDDYVGNVNPKFIRWIVNGQSANQLSTVLELPFAVDDYVIQAIVTLKDGSERYYSFTLNASHNMPLDNKGYIEYDEDEICVTGPTVGQSCPSEDERAGIIVIIDPVF